MNKKIYKLITFASTTKAMNMEEICLSEKLPGRLIPLPQKIDAGCGLAWRVSADKFAVLAQAKDKWQFLADKVLEITM